MSRAQVLVFGGTTEGRRLARLLAGEKVRVLLCVATPYGEEQLPPRDFLTIRAGRLDAHGMVALIREQGGPLVVDATHPHAKEVTANICAACRRVGAERIRVLRSPVEQEGARILAGADEAAAELAKGGERALLTVGSKELAAFTRVPGYRDKLFVRVLPDPQILQYCRELGFAGRNLIGMQGPFSHGLNAAMMRDLEIDALVSKDSGDVGGLGEKLSAARETGARVLLIRRPDEGEGIPYGQAVELLGKRFGFETSGNVPSIARFPLFVDLQGRQVVVVGGGEVATRRISVLLEFGAQVVVVSPAISPGLERLLADKRLRWRPGRYKTGDLEGAELVLVATDDRAVNRQAGRDAQELEIPVNMADRREEGSFWFPAVARAEGLVLGLVSERGEHGKVKEAAAVLRKELQQRQ